METQSQWLHYMDTHLNKPLSENNKPPITAVGVEGDKGEKKCL